MKVDSALSELRLCVRMYLETSGMSQREFCKLAHVDRNTVWRLLKGQKVNMTMETLVKIASQAGVRIWIM